ncbi:mandelate racemase/muconate lactonizing enzyme family protein [Ancylobacter sp. MQZ15Z-1]|uniref:Mandelate racemase/muconate lactonizing enzyme family protein n=1 Tax=Ancylobacter mangrovi TaxID=2972472 RepID=A0A9X2PD52_9HYPH|nr:mandelate racemase/muconate lactonizing enzyme family protein [Ancylobacter mangrovi]MCS0496496.1 mandelate racemase/muconate lactonizing enzyme family protein [Ancylobacter mangrovi]
MRATILVHRVPAEPPVRTSFGIMHDRPSVLVRVEDDDGAFGYGEVWCNYPSVGAEHRARLLETVVLPLVGGSGLVDQPAALWTWLTERLRVLAIQSGEPGPLAHCVAGLECALQDLAARRAGVPLATFLAPDAAGDVAVYASGINPTGAPETAAAAIAAGYGGCKIKIGFDPALDRANLLGARQLIGDDRLLMADANQAWDLDEALAFASTADDAGLRWLEEPLCHPAADDEWRQLGDAMRTPLAAGENYTSQCDFDALAETRHVRVVQPDLGRWGGVGRIFAVGRSLAQRGLTFCPHWLGGGVGLLTSCHVKAAVGDVSGLVEVDFNPNPIRSEVAAVVFDTLRDGRVKLNTSPGIGVEDAMIDDFSRYLVWSRDVRF